jgi:hypothetical protein
MSGKTTIVVEGYPFPMKHPKDYGALQLQKMLDAESSIVVRGKF